MNWKDTPPIIKGGAVVVVGDLHLSSIFQGSHRDYTGSCYENMERIYDICVGLRDRYGKVALFILGDLIGVKERNIKNAQFFSRVYSWLYSLNTLCNGHVYSVKGNHDMGVYTDFDMIVSMGLIKNPDHIDYQSPGGSLEGRFHFVNYGDEHRELDLCSESNVVIGHADYTITGVTNWYTHKDSVEITDLSNMQDVDFVISGHIHTPSPEPYSVLMGNGSTVQLFYPGSPARVSERYPDCSFTYFFYDSESKSTDFDSLPFGLKSIEEEFLDDSETLSEESVNDSLDTDKLVDIIGKLSSVTTVEGTLIEQINSRSEESETVKKLAIEFLTACIPN